IEAIPKGQIEAARSVGLSVGQTARFVTLPQAVRIVLPPLGNEFIAMLKDTALLSVIGVGDVTQKARELGAATLNLFPPYNSAAVRDIVLTLAASRLLKSLGRRSAWTRCAGSSTLGWTPRTARRPAPRSTSRPSPTTSRSSGRTCYLAPTS